mmetsp:Transcript_56615/g.143329  ORF Transcript_56615/g.143329 Transcript_56615/m.143329 type:complete len:204 (+) Transcript_56615:1266-1877(+)
MYYAMGVDVVHSQQHLPYSVRRVFFREPLYLRYAIEQLAALHALHHEGERVITLVDVEEACYVRVIHAQEDLDLGFELAPLVFGEGGVQLELLDRKPLVATAVFGHCHPHDAIVARAKSLVHDLIIVRKLLPILVVAPREGNLTNSGLEPLRDVREVIALRGAIPHAAATAAAAARREVRSQAGQHEHDFGRCPPLCLSCSCG